MQMIHAFNIRCILYNVKTIKFIFIRDKIDYYQDVWVNP